MPESAEDQLRSLIADRSARVGVIGLGYVGLPLALSICEAGLPVLGFDVDGERVEGLNRGCSPIPVFAERLRVAVERGRFRATADFSLLGEPDVIVICVPTPLTLERDPDLTFVRRAAESVAATLRRGQLVVLESTTYPGTTEEVLLDILGAAELDCGVDYFLAYSPEREDPGNPTYSTSNIPKVVGGVDPVSGDLALAFYGLVVDATVPVSNSRVAEATKLTENVFRSVNIALVNELKLIFEGIGVDVWEVLDAASTKPFGFMRFNPGPGWGGHCIPIDPFYLAWKARAHGLTTRFIELAGEINTEMTRHVIDKLQSALNEDRRAVNGSQVLVLGIAYKKDVSDARESPAFDLIERLLELGAEIVYHDPYVPTLPATRTWAHLPPLESQPLTAELLRRQDAVLLVTDHTTLDYDLILEHSRRIVDTRGKYRDAGRKVVRA